MTLTFPKNFASVADLNKREAIIAKNLMTDFLLKEDYTPLKPLVAKVIHRLDEDKDVVIKLRQKLANKYGLLESRRRTKTDNLSEESGLWLCRITDRGREFMDWLEEAGDEGLEWGTEDHPEVRYEGSGSEGDWVLGDLGFRVNGKLPYGVWKDINKEIKARGYETVIVPPDSKVYLKVVKDGKNKAVLIPTWEEVQEAARAKAGVGETVEEKRARLEAELAALKEEA